MNSVEITLARCCLQLRSTGALWWPEPRVLCVSDLHLGKSERIARRGGTLLPPFETQDTLARLEAEIAALLPAQVICLGDSFDDVAAAQTLPEADRAWIARLMAGREWTWIEGNHDPGPMPLGGTTKGESHLAPLTFRHIARPDAGPGEISGHYHPKVILHARGRTVRRAAFMHDATRLILPAFGTFTGGLNVQDRAFARIMGNGTRAILTGTTMAHLPVTWDPAPA